MDTPIGTPSTSHGGRAPGTVRSKNAVAQQSALSPDEIDPATRMLYTPHTVTGLIIGESGTPQLGICLLRLLYFVFYVCGVAALVYSSRAFNPPGPKLAEEDDIDHTIRHGLVAAVFVWLGYAFLQGPATCMVRPHPAVWRIIHGIIIVYLLICVFLLFQNVHDARKFLQLLYPDLGVDSPERAYGSDCRLYIQGQGINWPVIKGTLFDEFVIAHTLGWWGKAVILRNYPLLWVLSVGFELMELTFQHMLPNFNECWWDSWILDVALCNFIGLLAGMWTVRYFGSLEYDWRGISQQPTLAAKAKRSLAQLGPKEVDRFEWHAFSSPLRCLQCLGPLAMILLCEVNAFFLKYILWVPPLNPLNTYRLVLLFALAVPAVREWYMFIETGQKDVFNKLGPFAWLGIALSLVETLIVVKFGRGMFPNQWPRNTLLAWGTTGGLFAFVMTIWSIHHYLLRPKRKAD